MLLPPDDRRLDLRHPPQLPGGPGHQVRGGELHRVARPQFDLVPELLEIRVQQPLLFQNALAALALVQDAALEIHAALLLHLVLQLLRELLEALARHHREPVDQRVKAPLAILAHRQTQAAPDRLPPLALGADLAQCANLENVRVVPSLAQRRVAEDEAQRLARGEQPLLVAHDQIVSLVIRLGRAPLAAVLGLPLVHGKIPIVHLFHRQRIQGRVTRLLGKLPVQLRKPLPKLPIRLSVMRHAVHEEKRQHLHSLLGWQLRDTQLLLKVLPNRLPHLNL